MAGNVACFGRQQEGDRRGDLVRLGVTALGHASSTVGTVAAAQFGLVFRRPCGHRVDAHPPVAEFLRQNELLANIWTGLGATTSSVVEPDRHHFSIIDGLADAEHALTRTLLSE